MTELSLKQTVRSPVPDTSGPTDVRAVAQKQLSAPSNAPANGADSEHAKQIQVVQYTVKSGDTLTGIAKQFVGNDPAAIRAAIQSLRDTNPAIKNTDHIQVGQKLAVATTQPNASQKEPALSADADKQQSQAGTTKAPPAAVASTGEAQQSSVDYEVKAGNSLTKIAKIFFGNDPAQIQAGIKLLREQNPAIRHSDTIAIGQILKVIVPGKTSKDAAVPSQEPHATTKPAQESIYIVKTGDNLSKIAFNHHLRLADILEANPQYKEKPGGLKIGDSIAIPENKAVAVDDQATAATTKPTVSPIASPQAFSTAMRLVNHFEGGISKDQDDPANRGGKITNAGITQGAYDSWNKENGRAPKPVSEITNDERISLLKQDYWEKVNAPYLHDTLAIVVYDTAVNAGAATANRMLQKALGKPTNEKLDADDISESQQADQLPLIRRYLDLRLKYYNDIVEHREQSRKFLPGWTNRVNALWKFAKENA